MIRPWQPLINPNQLEYRLVITTTARVVSYNSRMTLVEIEPAGCVGCVEGGCKQKMYPRSRVEIPGEYHSSVELSLSLHNHLVLLLHSLMLPLVGFVLGAVTVSGNQVGEPLVIAGSVTGLLLGILVCKVQSHDRLKLTEVELYD